FPITPPALGPTSALSLFVSLLILPPPISTLFPYTTLFRSDHLLNGQRAECARLVLDQEAVAGHLPKLLADDADRDVGRTAGAERYHHPDRFRRIFVLCRSAGDAAGKEEER